MYTCRVSDKLAFYMQLEVADKYDRFNLSVGYGEPGAVPRPYNPFTPASAVHQPGRFRISSLVPGPYNDRWILLDPNTTEPFATPLPIDDSLAMIPAALDEVFERIAKYALPYFRAVAESQGHTFDPKMKGSA